MAKEARVGKRTPAEIVGYLAMVCTIWFGAIQAFEVLGFGLRRR